MNTNKTTECPTNESVVQITDFHSMDNDLYAVSVVFESGSEWCGQVSVDRFNLMKEEELVNEVLNIQLIKTDIDRDLFSFMNDNSHIFGLCAWCQSYFTRSDNQPVFKLTSEEFETTRQPENSVSHSCCGVCANNQKQELKELNDKKKKVILNSNEGNTMKRFLMILVVAATMMMSACSSPIGPAPTDGVIEYPNDKGMDVPDTNAIIINPTI